MDFYDRFDETSSPPREAFVNTLTESEITEKNHENAMKV